MDFDPLGDPAAVSALQQQQEELLRRVALAAALRKQSMSSENGPMPEGQMVSGHFVPPSILQHIAAVANPLMQKYDANVAENRASQQQQVLQQAIAAAKQRAIAQFPQGTPGQEAVPEQQGNNPSAYVPGQEAVAPQLPNAMQRLKWMGQASQIPGFAPTAQGMDKILGEEITREDKQKEAQSVLKQTLAAQRQSKLEQLQMQHDRLLQQAQLAGQSNELRAQLAEQANQVRLQIAAMSKTDKGALTAAQQGVQDRFNRQDVERLSDKMVPVMQMVQGAENIQSIIDKHTNPKTGAVSSIPGFGFVSKLGTSAGMAEALHMVPEGTVKNMATVRKYLNSVLKANAGLSQTITEQANTMLEMLAGGNYDQKQFLDNWNTLADGINKQLSNVKARATPETQATYKQQGARLSGVRSTLPQWYKWSAPDEDSAPVAPTATKDRVYNRETGKFE